MSNEHDPDFKRVTRHHANLHYMECGHVASGLSHDDYILCLTCSNERQAQERAERERLFEEDRAERKRILETARARTASLNAIFDEHD